MYASTSIRSFFNYLFTLEIFQECMTRVERDARVYRCNLHGLLRKSSSRGFESRGTCAFLPPASGRAGYFRLTLPTKSLPIVPTSGASRSWPLLDFYSVFDASSVRRCHRQIAAERRRANARPRSDPNFDSFGFTRYRTHPHGLFIHG